MREEFFWPFPFVFIPSGDMDFECMERDEDYVRVIPESYNKYIVTSTSTIWLYTSGRL